MQQPTPENNRITLRTSALCVMCVTLLACGPQIADGTGDSPCGFAAGDGDGDPGATPGPYEVGGVWGPCPTDLETGIHDLCFDPSTACVPGFVDNTATSAICLPLDDCPLDGGPSAALEMGDGGVCYPRCADPTDCALGMKCDAGWSGGFMCSWPLG